MATHVPERKNNPFIRSSKGGRALSALQLPWFSLRPPTGFGVLTTTGRKSGKRRPRCVRAIRRDDKVYIVSIGGDRAAWVRNLDANPNVRLRIRGGRFSGVARRPRDRSEIEEARSIYCGTVNPFDFTECRVHRPGKPTREKILELHRGWFERGTPLIIELR